jgi:ribonuclease HII
MPWTVEPARDLFVVAEVDVQVEAAVEIDASASL